MARIRFHGAGHQSVTQKAVVARAESKAKNEAHRALSIQNHRFEQATAAPYPSMPVEQWMDRRGRRPSGRGHLCLGATYDHTESACGAKDGFTTPKLEWLDCVDCLVAADWAMASGYVVANTRNELYDPDPLDPGRRKLRKEWNRLCRAIKEKKA